VSQTCDRDLNVASSEITAVLNQNLSLYLTKHHDAKTCGGMEV